jgi:dTDP-4-dehydrorhamnose 3,5-epimerase
LTVQDTAIEDVKIITPKRFGDARGYFCESYSARALAQHGLAFDFVQDNQSLSAQKNTIRGLHFQGPPSAQTKLIGCLVGAIFDVAVDLRHGSPTFGQHVAVELSAENGKQLLVPRGFGHGFCTLTDGCLIQYKVDAYYDPNVDFGICFDDPDLNISWPVSRAQAILSAKDQAAPRLKDAPAVFTYLPKGV